VIQNKKLENYIYEFFSPRSDELNMFYRSVHQNRRFDVYPLKNGNKIMDFILSLQSNVEEKFFFKRLIPQQFPTPKSLLNALTNFKIYIEENQKLVEPNLDGEDTSYVVSYLMNFTYDLINMIDYCQEVFDSEETIVPYQELRMNLIQKNIDDFIRNLKSILASVSYAINKTKEGYYHSNVHLILKLLGFDIISEEETNVGRIDGVIRFTSIIYIVEFKFDNAKESSELALEQIKENKYYEKFLIDNKDIIGIGIGFSDKERNISGYSHDILSE
jgi:hypothetical protein